MYCTLCGKNLVCYHTGLSNKYFRCENKCFVTFATNITFNHKKLIEYYDSIFLYKGIYYSLIGWEFSEHTELSYFKGSKLIIQCEFIKIINNNDLYNMFLKLLKFSYLV